MSKSRHQRRAGTMALACMLTCSCASPPSWMRFAAAVQPADASTQSRPAAAFLPDTTVKFLDFSTAWPTRATRQPADPIQGVIVPMSAKVSRLMPSFASFTPAKPGETDLEDYEALTPAKDLKLILEGHRGLTFYETTAQEARRKGFGRGPGRAAGPDASLVFRFVSGVEQPPTKGEPAGKLLIQRTWFAYYDPIEPAPTAATNGTAKPDTDPAKPTPPTKGVILLMPGLYGTPEPIFDLMIKEFRQNNWGVLRMLSQPSRFTERVRMELDPQAMEASAKSVADILGDRAGECALAAQAAWNYLEQQRPELAKLPKGIIGTSGGGMTLPTVVAREPDRYAACILIGAAADFWLIARRSAYTNDAASIDVRIKGMDKTPPEHDPAFDWRRFDELYLASCLLDSFHTAKAMHGKKVLMLQGDGDLAVPAPLGDILWERLGKPERWLYPTGHEGLVIEMVPRDIGKIIAWFKSNGLE